VNGVSTSDVIVVMGVSGSGKSAVGRSLAAETGWDFVEGEQFLDDSSRAALREGTLADEAYDAWLKSVGDWMDSYEGTGRSAVVACSALTRHQRDVLREGRPHVRFCHLTAHRAALKERVGADGAKHLRDDVARFQPLEPGEPGVTVTAEGDADDVARRALADLGLDPGHS
jgi:gluconokinase